MGMNKSFRDIILAELQRRDWSGYRLAQECGVPARTIQRWLADDNDLTAARLELICKALGLELRPTKKGK